MAFLIPLIASTHVNVTTMKSTVKVVKLHSQHISDRSFCSCKSHLSVSIQNKLMN